METDETPSFSCVRSGGSTSTLVSLQLLLNGRCIPMIEFVVRSAHPLDAVSTSGDLVMYVVI